MQGPMGDLSEPTALLSTKVRHRLTGLGLDEVVTNTIVEADWLELVGAATGPGVNLANPPTEAQGWLRASLLPSLLLSLLPSLRLRPKRRTGLRVPERNRPRSYLGGRAGRVGSVRED